LTDTEPGTIFLRPGDLWEVPNRHDGAMRTLERPAVTTVGYEGRTAGELVDLMQRSGVTLLVDVRLTPISRKPGLSKTKLGDALREAGIEYLHMPTLGNPQDNREGYRQAEASAVARFRSLMRGAAARHALDGLAARIADESVALLCFERDHATCHRSLVIEALRQRTDELTVHNI